MHRSVIAVGARGAPRRLPGGAILIPCRALADRIPSCGTAMSANATVAHRFVEALARHGVEVMFGQSLPSQLHLAAPEFGRHGRRLRPDQP